MNHLDSLTHLAQQIQHITYELEATRAERDQAIRQAAAAGHPIAHVARAASLTRQSVYDVLRDNEDGSSTER